MSKLVAQPGDTIQIINEAHMTCWYKPGEEYIVTNMFLDNEDGWCYNIQGQESSVWVREEDCRVVRSVLIDGLQQAADFVGGAATSEEAELTGGSVNYYKVEIKNPTTAEEPYTAECNDIIEALKMNYAEGNAFKAIWRSCAARLGKLKKGMDAEGVYDAEKIVFFGERILIQRKEEA